jgi:hypothetical protein
MSSSGHHITDADREQLAQQEYSKSYADCDTHERRHIAGKFAASVRLGTGSTGGGSNEHNLRSSAKASTTTKASTTKSSSEEDTHERLAQAEYGRSYSDLDEHERRRVGGKMAAETRAARQT